MVRSHDPTSVVARKLQSQSKLAHRIKLKKQLEKARRKNGVDTNAPGRALEPEIEAAVARVASGPAPRSKKQLVATHGPSTPRRTSEKPNPMKRALQLREERLSQMRTSFEVRAKEAEDRTAANKKVQADRERLREKLTAKTRTGQLKLSNHIDVLLGKIRGEKK